ncbi:MAG: hypothetical protein JSS51_01380 [Planctomycetes bacterium]|nr:hypothetical protein [Planctomycetota bacterium]
MNAEEMRAWLTTHGTTAGKHNSRTGAFSPGMGDSASAPRFEGLTPIEIESRLKLARTKVIELDHHVKTGRLVDAEKVRACYVQHLAEVRGELESLPSRAVGPLLAALKVDGAEAANAIAGELASLLQEMMQRLSGGETMDFAPGQVP